MSEYLRLDLAEITHQDTKKKKKKGGWGEKVGVIWYPLWELEIQCEQK